MLSQLLETINSKYPLSSRGSAGFDGIKIKGMTFNISSYEAEGLGDRYDLIMQERCQFYNFDQTYYLYQRNENPVTGD